MCRTCTPTSISIRNCWKKERDSLEPRESKSRPQVGRFFYGRATLGRGRGILRTEVFNTFVENAVEKHLSTFLSDSPRDASTLCTEASAGTFVVEPADKLIFEN